MDHFGKRVSLAWNDEATVLTIVSLDTQRVDLEMVMPTFPVITGSQNPDNDCAAQGAINEGWYDPVLETLVLRMLLESGRSGCELPEQWVMRRL